MAAKSNSFYRLVRAIEQSKQFEIYDFHTAINGFMWYQYHEAEIDENGKKQDGYHGETKKLGYGESAKQRGNEFYKNLKAKGYVFYGIYEQDVCGKETKIK